jgi:hypothetical protein
VNNDYFIVPNLNQLIANGVLAPQLPRGGFTGLSGLRYTDPWPRGLLPWKPHKSTQVIMGYVYEILVEYEDYLPLTVRQIFYRLVGKVGYPKTENTYDNLGEYLNRARRSGELDWAKIRDDSLTGDEAPGFSGPQHFWNTVQIIAGEYVLRRAHGQPRHIEVWCEAAGMTPQLKRVADDFGVGVYSASGFEGTGLKHDVVTAAINRYEPTVVLRVGDLDQSGISIFDAFADDILAMCEDEGRPGAIEFQWVLVRPEHETAYGLERGFPKATDNRGGGICPITGLPYNPPWTYTVQAEAFAPDVMAALLRDALRRTVDMDILAEAIAASDPQRDAILARLDRITG